MWADGQENPYIDAKCFDWFRCDHVCGRRMLWCWQSYRLSDIDSTANQRHGIAVDWPIRHAMLRSYQAFCWHRWIA